MSVPDNISSIERPAVGLMTYYVLRSLLAGPGFPVLLALLFFRFRTLRYRFDDEGISMSWGALFRREVHLTYARIQDIHLTSNVVERRLGLARIQVQTASGSSDAEMTIEGVPQFSELRDFLYSRMRGARAKPPAPLQPPEPSREVAAALREVAEELRAVRRELEARKT